MEVNDWTVVVVVADVEPPVVVVVVVMMMINLLPLSAAHNLEAPSHCSPLPASMWAPGSE